MMQRTDLPSFANYQAIPAALLHFERQRIDFVPCHDDIKKSAIKSADIFFLLVELGTDWSTVGCSQTSLSVIGMASSGALSFEDQFCKLPIN